jgi:hypothetical protein
LLCHPNARGKPNETILKKSGGIVLRPQYRHMKASRTQTACRVPKLCSQCGIMSICRQNVVLRRYTDDAKKLRG